MLEQFKFYANGTGSKVAKTIPCFLDNFYGRCAGAGYFQVHDAASLPSNGAVPLIEYSMAGGAGNFPGFFSTDSGPVEMFNGVVFAMSSTSGTLTLSATSFDVWGALGITDLAWTVTGLSTTTNTDNFSTLWAGSSTGKRLYDMSIVNNEGATVYPMIFFAGAYSNGQTPNWVGKSIANGATGKYNFGYGGQQLPSSVASGSIAPKVVLSTTPATLTQSVGLASAFTIHYKIA